MYVQYVCMTLSTPLPLLQSQQNEVAIFLHCRSGYRQCTESFKKYLESFFLVDSGHLFNFCLAPSCAKKTQIKCSDSDPRGFADRNQVLLQQNLLDQNHYFLDGFSQLRMILDKNYKYVHNCLEMSFLNMFLKIL
jgi:hypothetical protein